VKLEFYHSEWDAGIRDYLANNMFFNLLIDGKDSLYGVKKMNDSFENPIAIMRYSSVVRKYPCDYDLSMIKYDCINIYLDDLENGFPDAGKYTQKEFRRIKLGNYGPRYYP